MGALGFQGVDGDWETAGLDKLGGIGKARRTESTFGCTISCGGRVYKGIGCAIYRI